MLFVSLPILVFAVSDAPLDIPTTLAFPELYRSARKEFNVFVFLRWILLGVYDSIIVYFFVQLGIGEDVIDQYGKTSGLFSQGIIMYTALVFIVNLR